MNTLVVLSALLAVALAKPQFGGRPGARPVAGGSLNDVPIVRQASDVRPDGYSYSYETGNGIQANEEGVLENAGNPELEAINARGGFSYVGDDGVTYTITYVADAAGGFQPQGAHLPTPPPVPEAIARALDFIARNPQPEGNFGGRPAARPSRPGFGRK
ncbi:hypothetical protein R5R35_008914 [Gryllus longicercus]|uniref:Cuticular protein n=1 Tax=Gryllus longicercus TaxID=2509291 RepID=A0AAN9VLW8_9ORTH